MLDLEAVQCSIIHNSQHEGRVPQYSVPLTKDPDGFYLGLTVVPKEGNTFKEYLVVGIVEDWLVIVVKDDGLPSCAYTIRKARVNKGNLYE